MLSWFSGLSDIEFEYYTVILRFFLAVVGRLNSDFLRVRCCGCYLFRAFLTIKNGSRLSGFPYSSCINKIKLLFQKNGDT